MLRVKRSQLTVKVTTGCLMKCKSAVVKVTSRQMSLLGEVTSGESLLLYMTITTHWAQSDLLVDGALSWLALVMLSFSSTYPAQSRGRWSSLVQLRIAGGRGPSEELGPEKLRDGDRQILFGRDLDDTMVSISINMLA
jgi:hypothetical protein